MTEDTANKMLRKALGRKASWELPENPSANTSFDQQDLTEDEVPTNYQAMGESYSDSTNFEVQREHPGRLN